MSEIAEMESIVYLLKPYLTVNVTPEKEKIFVNKTKE